MDNRISLILPALSHQQSSNKQSHSHTKKLYSILKIRYLHMCTMHVIVLSIGKYWKHCYRIMCRFLAHCAHLYVNWYSIRIKFNYHLVRQMLNSIDHIPILFIDFSFKHFQQRYAISMHLYAQYKWYVKLVTGHNYICINLMKIKH